MSSAADAELREMLAEKAKELFQICDTAGNGFITKRDMQRLCGPLPLQPDQVETVFDKLDGDGNGYLTLDEFTGGFGAFMGIQTGGDTEAAPSGPHEAEGEFVEESLIRRKPAAPGFHGNGGPGGVGDYCPDDDEHYRLTMEKLGASGVLRDEENVKELWSRLQMEHPELVPGLESLLVKMSAEIQKSHDSCNNLEKVLRTKTTAHDEEVRRLYDEMEAQIRSERDKVLAEERAREKLLREEMEREIREKEKLCHELMKNHESLELRLTDLNQIQAETAQENERLGRERDALEEELEESREALQESQAYVEDLQRKFKDDRRRRAQAAISLTEGIALEREQLVRQLDSLRDSNKRLKDASDIAGGLDGRSGAGAGEVVHFWEGGGGDGGGGEGSAKDFNRQESLQNLMASAAVVAVGETLADIMGGEDDGCEFDDMSRAEFRSHEFGQCGDEDEEIEEDVIAPVAHAEAASERLPPRSPSPVPPSVKETAEIATMVTPCPSRPSTPSPERRETEIQTDETREPTPPPTPLPVPLLLPLLDEAAARAAAASSLRLDQAAEIRGSPEGARDEEFLLGGRAESPGVAAESAIFLVNRTPERVFKVVFVGDSGVGKSSVLHRFCQNSFKSTFSATIGIDFQVKAIDLEGQVVALQLWDTAGQERFRSITKQYFRKADGIVIVYDVTNAQSYLHLREWLDSVQDGADEGSVKMLLGNKADLIGGGDQSRAVEADSARQLADEYDNTALFFEVSAKSGASVSEAFIKFAMLLREKEDKELRNAIRISADIEKKKSCCLK